jgi:hypothetical protein
VSDVLASQVAGVAVPLKPTGIDQQPFRDVDLQPVQLSAFLLTHGD